MPEFRTASGLVSVIPYMRTASGLTKVDTRFYGASGPVDTGGGSTALAITPDQSGVFGAGASNSSITVATNEVTAVVTGGTGSGTYAWSTATGWTRTAPNAAITAFSTNVGSGVTKDATFTCTFTDANGQSVTSSTVSAEVSNFGRTIGGAP